VTLNQATVNSIPNGTSLKLDNSIGRSVVDGNTTAGSNILTSSLANFQASDLNLDIEATQLPVGTTITSVDSTTQVHISNNANVTGTTDVVTIGGKLEVSNNRVMNDATYTSTTVVKSPQSKWTTDDVGLTVTGTGLSNCVIASVAGQNATMTSACVTVDALTHTIVVGSPSATAPANGETIVNEGVQLALAPNFVKGSRPCAEDHAAGFDTIGTWLAPGSFAGTGLQVQPAGTRAIGEIQFGTAVASYYAYVIQRPTTVGTDPNSAPHFDVVFPFVPTGTALCASATSPGLGFSMGIGASTPAVAALPLGYGKPSSAQLRAIRDNDDAGWNQTSYMVDDATNLWTGPNFNRLCQVAAGPPNVDFNCGSG
jgi:hypothetical protein